MANADQDGSDLEFTASHSQIGATLQPDGKIKVESFDGWILITPPPAKMPHTHCCTMLLLLHTQWEAGYKATVAEAALFEYIESEYPRLAERLDKLHLYLWARNHAA